MLFNRNGDGAVELQELTGVYYASNNFASIEGEIIDATREVGSIVGNGVVALAEQRYGLDDSDKLVRAVQMPIACLAMCRYFRMNTVSHEDGGRSVHLDDSEKMPFEWMLDRDDRAMREKYFRALDALFAYLEQNNIKEWQDSPACKNAQLSIVKDIHTFERVYPIEQSRYTFFMLLPLIIEVQDSHLRRLVGDAWDKITCDNLAEEDTYLLRAVQKVAILRAVIIAVERWSVDLFPQAVARRFSPTYQGNRSSISASTNEIDWYLNRLRQQVDEAMQDIHSYINGGNQYQAYPLTPDNERNRKFFTTGL